MNKLTPTKTVKRELSGVRISKASGGFIVSNEYKWRDLGQNERYEPEPDPMVFGEGQNEQMMKHVCTTLGIKESK